MVAAHELQGYQRCLCGWQPTNADIEKGFTHREHVLSVLRPNQMVRVE